MPSDTKRLAKDDWPCLAALLILSLSLFLFGADAPSSSFLISSLTFFAAIMTLIFRPEVKLGIWSYVWLIVWCTLTIAHGVTGRLADSEHDYFMLLAGGCFFWFGRYGSFSRRRRNRILQILAAFALIYGVFAFIQHISAPNFILGSEKRYHFDRLTGTFLSANTTAMFLGMLFLVCSYRVMKAFKKSTSLRAFLLMPVSLCAILISSTCILLTASRAGAAAVCIGFVLLMIAFLLPDRAKSNSDFSRQDMSLTIGVGIVVFLVALVGIWSLSGELVEGRLDSISRDAGSRQILFDACWRAGELEPYLGHGLGGFRYAIDFVSTAEHNQLLISQNAAHNVFAQWFVQAGWPGLFGLCALIGLSMLRVVYSSQDWLPIGLQASILTQVLLHSIFDYGLEIPSVFLLFAFILGLIGEK